MYHVRRGIAQPFNRARGNSNALVFCCIFNFYCLHATCWLNVFSDARPSSCSYVQIKRIHMFLLLVCDSQEADGDRWETSHYKMPLGDSLHAPLTSSELLTYRYSEFAIYLFTAPADRNPFARRRDRTMPSKDQSIASRATFDFIVRLMLSKMSVCQLVVIAVIAIVKLPLQLQAPMNIHKYEVLRDRSRVTRTVAISNAFGFLWWW